MDTNEFTYEQIVKARTAKSPAELLALARESGIEMTEESAEKFYSTLHVSRELSDDELDGVAGGGCGKSKPSMKQKDSRGWCESYICNRCGAAGFDKRLLDSGAGRFCSGCTQWADCETCRYGVPKGYNTDGGCTL